MADYDLSHELAMRPGTGFYNSDEIKMINNYVDMLMEMYEPISGDVPYAELSKLQVFGLREMMADRNLKFSNKKSGMILCLRHEKPKRKRLLAGVLNSLWGNMRRYGNDGMGDKPIGMCRVEYWLGHINPDRILYNKKYELFAPKSDAFDLVVIVGSGSWYTPLTMSLIPLF